MKQNITKVMDINSEEVFDIPNIKALELAPGLFCVSTTEGWNGGNNESDRLPALLGIKRLYKRTSNQHDTSCRQRQHVDIANSTRCI